jgi:hypothetical protein
MGPEAVEELTGVAEARSDQARDEFTSSGSRIRGCGLVLEPIAKVSRLISAALVSLTVIGVTRSFGRFVLLLRAPLLNRSQSLGLQLVGHGSHVRIWSLLSVRKPRSPNG